MIRSKNQLGMTLLELTVVLLILIALAGLAVPYVGGTGSMAMCRATDATLRVIRDAIMGGASGFGFYNDTLGKYPQQTRGDYSTINLTYLFTQPSGFGAYNPNTGVGWRGPYLMSGQIPAGIDTSFTTPYDPSSNISGKIHADISGLSQVVDGWNRPIVLQIPYNSSTSKYERDNARLISAGPGSGIRPGDASIDTAIHDNPDATGRGDDRVLFLHRADLGSNVPCD